MDDTEYGIIGKFTGIPIQTLQVPKDSVIVLRYTSGNMSIDEFAKCYMKIKDEFPDNEVIALPDDLSIKAMSYGSLISILESTKRLIQDMIEYKNMEDKK